MSVFQGVAPWHTIFTSSCVIPLWDSAKVQSLPYKEFNPSPKEEARFFRALHLAIQFSRHPVTSLFGTQQQLKYPQVKSSSFPLWKNHVTQDLLFCDVLTLSYLGSLVWYSWILLIKSICAFILSVVNFYSERLLLSKRKDFIQCVVYFYSKRLPICRGV